MSDSVRTDVVARYMANDDKPSSRSTGAMACAVFTAILGCAFWAGAVVASTPLPH